MNCYGPLASWYDQLTGDVPYEAFAAYYEAEFARAGGEFRLLLDLCCGTGTLTALMAERGYELIAVDASEEMLMEAREKTASLPTPPLFLLQNAEELDLYGTVDAAYCSLDAMNYLPRALLPEVFRRLAQLAQFLEPELGMLLLVLRRLQEQRRDLLKALLLGCRGEIGIFVARLGFARKGLPEILFGLGARVFVCHCAYLLGCE